MGLYDDRLADLSEPRKPFRSRSVSSRPSAHRRPQAPELGVRGRAQATKVQSLLFDRDSGWTTVKAKSWAKSHGYKFGKVDVTDQYVRLRQFDPKGSKVKRTVPFGRGIRAVVAREESNNMAKARKARKARRRTSKKASRRRPRRKTAAKKTVRRRRARRASEPTAVAAPRRRRRRASTTMMAAAPRKRRRRRSRASEAWRGDSAGHRKAAKKGWRRKKRKSAPKRRRSRRRRASESSMMMAPRRRRRRSYGASAPRGQRMGQAAQMSVALISAGLGFVIADGLDRFLATYDPTKTTELPKDKFTSTGAGTLANTLNVASPPGWARIGAGVGAVAVPAVGAMYAENKWLRASLEGATLGAGVSLFKTLWNSFLMPMLKPKDTSPMSLQKSYIARLYPAEVSAAVNLEAKQTAVSSAGSGALSGAPDVGPFALAGDSPYASASDALKRGAGVSDIGPENAWGAVSGDSPYPDANQALRREAGIGAESPYADAAQALRREAGMGAPAATGNPGQPGLSWAPGPPPGPGPGPQARPHSEEVACDCLGDDNQFLGFVGDEDKPNETPFLTTS